MDYSLYSLERYKILVNGLGKNLKKIEVLVHMFKGKIKNKILGSPQGGSSRPLKMAKTPVFRGLLDPPPRVTSDLFFSFFF